MNSKKFADSVMPFLEKYNSYTDKDKIIAHYGLETLYILTTKMIIITLISVLFGITKEMFIFLLFYSVLRSYAGGLHLSSSIECTILSSIILIGLPIVCKNIIIIESLRIIIIGFSICLFALYSPADTYKKPLIKEEKRVKLRLLSFIMCILYFISSLIIEDDYILNNIALSLFLEGVLITPFTYKLFKQPYNNHLIYGSIKKKGE